MQVAQVLNLVPLKYLIKFKAKTEKTLKAPDKSATVLDKNKKRERAYNDKE